MAIRRPQCKSQLTIERLENRNLLAAVIANLPATNIGPKTATIGVEVVDAGGATPNVSIYWGTTDGGTETASWENVLRLGNRDVGQYTEDLMDLNIGSDYFYRGYGFSFFDGLAWAPETATFTTTPPDPATIISDDVNFVGPTSIGVSGMITDDGGQTPIVTVYYGDNDGGDSPAAWDAKVELGEVVGEFVTTVNQLSTNTTYFYRIAADNVGGTGWTETTSVQTLNAAPLQISELSAAGGTELVTRTRSTTDREFEGEERIYDWVEIENTTDQPIDISGYSLSDSKRSPQKWSLPEGSVVPEFGVFVVYASDLDISDVNLDENGYPHANFRLSRGGEYLGLFNPEGTVVFEFENEFPRQLPGMTYGAFGDQNHYFEIPTPFATNLPGAPQIAAAPTISVDSKTFTEPFMVEISTEQVDGVIRYTTDGTVPTIESTLYEGPMEISESTQLRVRTFAPDHVGSRIVGEGYTQLVESVPEFTSDLPIIVLDGFGNGRRPSKARHASWRMLVYDVNPETGVSSITAEPDHNTRLGIKVRGQSSSGDPKTPYRIEVRDQYDEDLDIDWFGLPDDADWVLQGPWSDRTLVHNSLAYELGKDIGLLAPRTRFVEVFRNQRTGPMEDDDYLGLYVLTENIKRSRNRVDIPDLDPGEVGEEEISGGYIVRFEQNVVEARDRLDGWQHLELLDGQKYSPEQKDWITNYINEVDAAIEKAGESRDYENFIDVDSMVNMLVLSEFGRDQDAYVRSHYYHKDRGGKLVSGPVWDFNLIWNRGCCFDNRNTRGWQFDQDRPGQPNGWNKGQHNWNGDLMNSHAFSQKFIDRWAELRKDGNPLSLDSLFARVDRQVAEIDGAQQRNYERWPNQLAGGGGFGGPRFPTFQEHIDDMKNWMSNRVEWIDEQFRQAPEIAVDAEHNVTISTTEENGQIFFTTGGSDPFDDNTGEPNATARLYDGNSFAVLPGAQIFARVRDANVNPRRTELVLTHWSAPTIVQVPQDFDLNDDQKLDLGDVHLLCQHLRDNGPFNENLDLDRNGSISYADLEELVLTGLDTTIGDANLDGVFNSGDLVSVFQAGEYEDATDGNSMWEEGDWNCDGDFTSRDIVRAFQFGGYSKEAATQPLLGIPAAIDGTTESGEQRAFPPSRDRLIQAIDELHQQKIELAAAVVDQPIEMDAAGSSINRFVSSHEDRGSDEETDLVFREIWR